MTTLSQIVLTCKISFTIRKNDTDVCVPEPARTAHRRRPQQDQTSAGMYVLITESGTNSTTDESIYAWTVGCYGEPHQALAVAAYNKVEITTAGTAW